MKTIKFSEIQSLDKHAFGGPGIYIFWSGRGKVLYVGRTKNVRDRLMQHRRIIEINSGSCTKLHEAAQKSRGGHRRWQIDIFTYEEVRARYRMLEADPALIETELIGRLTARLNTMDRPVKTIYERNFEDAARIMTMWRSGETDDALRQARLIKRLWNEPQVIWELEDE